MSPQDSIEGTDEDPELIELVPQEAPDDDSNGTNEQGKEIEGGQLEVIVEDEVTKKRKRFK